MAGRAVSVAGVSETLAGFARVEGLLASEARAIVGRSLGRIQADARGRCAEGGGSRYGYVKSLWEDPVKGHVRDQIKTQLHATDPMGAVFVERRGIGGRYGTDNVGLWLEYGTAARWNRRGAYRGQGPARPFLGPAVEAERPRLLADLQMAADRAARQA